MTTTQTKIPERGTKQFRLYAAEVMASDGPWESRLAHVIDEWTADLCPSWDWDTKHFRIAVPPQPVVKQWTFLSVPSTRLKVREKETGRLFVASPLPDVVALYPGVSRLDARYVDYERFARDFEQLDKSPCGTLEEVEWPKWYKTESGNLWRFYSETSGTFFRKDCGFKEEKPLLTLDSVESNLESTRITAAEAAELLRGEPILMKSSRLPYSVADANLDDARFIAESRNALPRLIAALREAVRALEKSSEAMNTCMDHCDGLGFTVMQTYDSPKIGAAHLSVRTALAKIETLLKS